MISFCSISQTKPKTRLIEERVLYSILEDNFRKDTLITLQDSIIASQANTIVFLDTMTKYVLSRILKQKEINDNLLNQNSILVLNNETLTTASYQLNEYINRCKLNVEAIETENKKLRIKNRILNRASLIGGASIVLNAILLFK